MLRRSWRTRPRISRRTTRPSSWPRCSPRKWTRRTRSSSTSRRAGRWDCRWSRPTSTGLARPVHGGGRGDPLRPGRDQERGRHRDRVHRARARGGRAVHLARRLLRARRPAPGEPAGDREPDQGGRVRLRSRCTRAGLLAALDQAMEAGQRRQRDREEGQVSLFDAGGRAGAAQRGGRRRTGSPRPSPSGPRRRCSPTRRRCSGFYLSGHPLERVPGHRRAGSGAVSAAELAARPSGRARAPAGAGERRSARARPRAATAWPSPRSTLVDGSVPLTIFPEPYRGCAARRSATAGPVLVRGRDRRQRQGPRRARGGGQPLEERGTWPAERRTAPAPGTAASRARLPHPGERGRRVAAGRCSPRCGRPARSTPARTPLFVHVLLPSRRWCSGSRELRVSRTPRSWRRSKRCSGRAVYSSSMPDELEFEKPLLELENRIAELRAVRRIRSRRATRSRSSRSGSRRQQQRVYASLTRLAARPDRPPPEAPAHPRPHRAPASRTGSSCTATASSATTRPSWAASPASRASPWW